MAHEATALPRSSTNVNSADSAHPPHPRRALPPHPVSDQFNSQFIPSLTNLTYPAKDNDASSLYSTHSSTTTATNTTTTSTSNLPTHLKRKHAHKHMRQPLPTAPAILQDDLVLTPTKTLPPTSGQQTVFPQSASSRLAQVQLHRSNTAPSPKRAPASHSSYGVETTAGPPPSFDTQRTLSQERVWRLDRSKSLRITPALDRGDTASQPQPTSLFNISPQTDSSDPLKHLQPPTPLLTQSSPDTTDTQSVPTPTDAADTPVMEVRSDYGLGVSNSEVDSKTSSESHKSEDLFLNIAKVHAGRPSSSKGEKRRSRVSLPFLPGPRPATSYNPEGIHMQNDAADMTPHAKHASVSYGQTRGLDQASDAGSMVASNSGLYSKGSSTLYADTIRGQPRAATGLRNSRLVSEGGYLDRAKISEQNATESTASTAAPSTVWDELDDLKSRIRKLELTGKLPPSSAAAMSSAERPRTATTAATTMSTSPKHNKVPHTLQSTFEGISPNIHPMLHEALGNAQSIVGQEVYQKLQAAAQDALQLASLANFDGQSERSGIPFASDRQLRRRTESLCRNLTELAIALSSESNPPTNLYRPASREYHASPGTALRSRRYSNGNESTDRPPVSNRVASRLEARKTSLQVGFPNPQRSSTDLDSPIPPGQYPGSAGRSIRGSTGFQSRRSTNYLDGSNEEEQKTPALRPISRAMTDVSAARRLSRDHAAASREYTRQHPMPNQYDSPSASKRTPLPSNVSTNFTSRRKYQSPAAAPTIDSSPLASRPSWGRITVVPQDSMPSPDTAPETPGTQRSASARRSFGLASRIGSSVGSRLRSTKVDRVESRSFKDLTQIGGDSMDTQEAPREQQYP